MGSLVNNITYNKHKKKKVMMEHETDILVYYACLYLPI